MRLASESTLPYSYSYDQPFGNAAMLFRLSFPLPSVHRARESTIEVAALKTLSTKVAFR